MAIRTMTGKKDAFNEDGTLRPNVEIVRDYHGAEEGIHHGPACAHHGVRHGVDKDFTPECVQHYSECVNMEPLYMETHHVGLVLNADGEHNFHDDSDFYAIVWNPAKGCPEECQYATTRGWTYPNSARADATPEVLTAYKAWQEGRAVEAQKARERMLEEQAAAKALTPEVGAPCRVVRGRKVAIGTEGTCIWKGFGDYGERVGILVDGAKVFTASSNVERVVAKPEGQTWVEYMDAAYNAAREAAQALPKKGDRLTIVQGESAGKSGPCIWSNGKRVGVATSTRKVKGKYADVVFTDADCVTLAA